MTGFRADETNQYPGFRIVVGKTYDSLNQIQQQTWKLVMIQNLGERGRMNSPMVSQSTAGRISESTTINENDVRLVYLLWESSTQSLDQHLAKYPRGGEGVDFEVAGGVRLRLQLQPGG